MMVGVELLVDNAPSHPVAEMRGKFQNLEIVALPKNTTAILQPHRSGYILTYIVIM